jgi:hypothetical protein
MFADETIVRFCKLRIGSSDTIDLLRLTDGKIFFGI